MRFLVLIVCLALTCTIPQPAKADMFGGDVAVLMQILANAITQLQQLKMILNEGQDTLNLMRDINKGINDSLSKLNTLGPYIDPGLYNDFKKVQELAHQIKDIYGIVVNSNDAPAQTNTDQVAAEALAVNNAIIDYASQLDQVGEEIKVYSHEVSPGGAQKLTAQSLGVMIHVMNQQLRATGTGLKLQAQAMMVQNRKEKESTRVFVEQTDQLASSLKATDRFKFNLPRF